MKLLHALGVGLLLWVLALGCKPQAVKPLGTVGNQLQHLTGTINPQAANANACNSVSPNTVSLRMLDPIDASALQVSIPKASLFAYDSSVSTLIVDFDPINSTTNANYVADYGKYRVCDSSTPQVCIEDTTGVWLEEVNIPQEMHGTLTVAVSSCVLPYRRTTESDCGAPQTVPVFYEPSTTQNPQLAAVVKSIGHNIHRRKQAAFKLAAYAQSYLAAIGNQVPTNPTEKNLYTIANNVVINPYMMGAEYETPLLDQMMDNASTVMVPSAATSQTAAPVVPAAAGAVGLADSCPANSIKGKLAQLQGGTGLDLADTSAKAGFGLTTAQTNSTPTGMGSSVSAQQVVGTSGVTSASDSDLANYKDPNTLTWIYSSAMKKCLEAVKVVKTDSEGNPYSLYNFQFNACKHASDDHANLQLFYVYYSLQNVGTTSAYNAMVFKSKIANDEGDVAQCVTVDQSSSGYNSLITGKCTLSDPHQVFTGDFGILANASDSPLVEAVQVKNGWLLIENDTFTIVSKTAKETNDQYAQQQANAMQRWSCLELDTSSTSKSANVFMKKRDCVVPATKGTIGPNSLRIWTNFVGDGDYDGSGPQDNTHLHDLLAKCFSDPQKSAGGLSCIDGIEVFSGALAFMVGVLMYIKGSMQTTAALKKGRLEEQAAKGKPLATPTAPGAEAKPGEVASGAKPGEVASGAKPGEVAGGAKPGEVAGGSKAGDAAKPKPVEEGSGWKTGGLLVMAAGIGVEALGVSGLGSWYTNLADDPAPMSEAGQAFKEELGNIDRTVQGLKHAYDALKAQLPQ